MSASNFIHLKVRTHYSLGESAIEPKDAVKAARAMNMPAVGVCDLDNLFASLEFSKAASDAGIQPIVGYTASIKRKGGLALSASAQVMDRLVLIAKDEAGYGNLLKIASSAYLNPSGGQAPLLDFEYVAAHSEGLIALTGAAEGAALKYIVESRADLAKEELEKLHHVFGDRLYVELSRHGIPVEDAAEEALINLAYELNLPLVATNDVRFVEADMQEAADALWCIADGTYVSEENRRRMNPNFLMKQPSEMEALFTDIPEAILNTHVIAERCAVKSPSRAPILPTFQSADGRNEEEEFCFLSREGLNHRMETVVFLLCSSDQEKQEKEKQYNERLEYELKMILRMKYAGYFLIVSDFIGWSKDHNIPVGPGRGSGAGSIVAWALRITELDPIRFGLLFERFLNPDRVSMPDFDIDFCQDRRGEVIEYVRHRYGTDRVAQIITFGKLQARAALRDVGRVLQLPYGQVDRISKLVPVNPANPVDLSQALEIEPLLRKEMEADEAVEKMVNISLQLEGLNRHASTHAAGIVIGDRPLDELVPMYLDPRSEMPAIQYTMKYAEEAGLVKFDFLGLKTLTVVKQAEQLVNGGKWQVASGKNEGNSLSLATCHLQLDMNTIPLDDRKTYEMLGKGDAVGVFQLESSGMRDVLRRMKPDTIEDIIALISLYRPGPMDNIPTYIERKHGKEKPEYPHPLLESILKETFGVIIYQEQVMEIARVLAGYTLAEADLLRRAMGKKIKAEMEAQREIFSEKAVANGIDKGKAAEIFDLIAKFASYGFNKSHAAAYALISYQTAYLKANHPAEFLVASMNYDMHDTDKLGVFIQEARRNGIKILPPDINKSIANFSVERNGEEVAIRYGLAAIKNVGGECMKLIVAEREANGLFKNITDFAKRTGGKGLNRRQFEFLVKSGALDELEPNRRRLMESAEIITSFAADESASSAQVSLFGEDSMFAATEIALPQVDDFPSGEKLMLEFEAIGFYLTRHPLDDFADVLKIAGYKLHSEFSRRLTSQFSELKGAGVIISSKFKTSKKGRFAFADISDPSGTYEVAIYDDHIIDTCRDLLVAGTHIAYEGDGKAEEGGNRIIMKSIRRLSDALAKTPMPPKKFVIKSESDLMAVINETREIKGRQIVLEVITPEGHMAEVEAVA